MLSFESLRGWVSIRALLPLLVMGCGAPDAEQDASEVGSVQEELCCSSADDAQAIDLGVLEPGQFLYSVGLGINNRGTVVGMSQVPSTPALNPFRAFRWTARTGMVALDTLGGLSSRAADVNDREQVVGTIQLADGTSRAALWDADGTAHDLGTLGGSHSSAEAINNRGQVVGVAINDSGKARGFIWSEREGMVDLGFPVGDFGDPRDINDAGVVVGRIEKDIEVLPFKWTKKQGMTVLDNLDGREAVAESINNRGDIAGYTNQAGWVFGVKWTGRTSSPVLLETLAGALQPWPIGINERGAIVGWIWPEDSDMAAVEWTSPSRVRLLPLEGAAQAYDINDRGQVVGQWNSHAFILETGKRRCKPH
ncbi:MAG: hypothetical protein EOO73_11855 [Myxococcales bacterium]|nr:MAG: hypothetical protein EOO73_11855 [Myxococcales bacterium]